MSPTEFDWPFPADAHSALQVQRKQSTDTRQGVNFQSVRVFSMFLFQIKRHKKTSLRFGPWDRFASLLEYRLRRLSASKENILKEGWRSSKSEQAYPEKPAANS